MRCLQAEGIAAGTAEIESEGHSEVLFEGLSKGSEKVGLQEPAAQKRASLAAATVVGGSFLGC